MKIKLLFARGAKQHAGASRQLTGKRRHFLPVLRQTPLHLLVLTHDFADNRRGLQVLFPGFIARFQ